MFSSFNFSAGKLGPPAITTGIVTNGSLVMSWLPPFTINGVHIEHYVININVTVSLGPSNDTRLVMSSVTTQKYAEMAEPYSGVCNTYFVCIQAQSHAGLGEAACFTSQERKSTCSPCVFNK